MRKMIALGLIVTSIGLTTADARSLWSRFLDWGGGCWVMCKDR